MGSERMSLQELLVLLRTAKTVAEIDDRKEEITELIPQIRIMFDYKQKNYAHQYDLWFHCLHTVINLPREIDDDMLYLAALLHDIGKPSCQVKGQNEDDPNMHYYGHPQKSMEIVRDEIIPELTGKDYRLSSKDQKRLIYYVEYHDDRVSLRIKHRKRHLKMVTLEEFHKLMLLQIADAKAHVLIPPVIERIRICKTLAEDTLAVEKKQAYKEGERK